MEIKKDPVDIVIVGFGWTGSLMAMELANTGLKIVALERGEKRDTYPDFAYPRIADELTYGIRLKLFQNISGETITVRHKQSDTALPYRRLGSFLPGNGLVVRVFTGMACFGDRYMQISKCAVLLLKSMGLTLFHRT